MGIGIACLKHLRIDAYHKTACMAGCDCRGAVGGGKLPVCKADRLFRLVRKKTIFIGTMGVGERNIT